MVLIEHIWFRLAQIGDLQAGLSIASTEAGWRILSELTLQAGSALCTESQIFLHQSGTYLSSSPLLPLHCRGLILESCPGSRRQAQVV